jgi:hypothetical protein
VWWYTCIISVTWEVEMRGPKFEASWAQVVHTYNPSYSGGRDQEDHSSKPARANSSWDPISKLPITKKGWQSSSRWSPWVQTLVPSPKKKFEGSLSKKASQILPQKTSWAECSGSCLLSQLLGKQTQKDHSLSRVWTKRKNYQDPISKNKLGRWRTPVFPPTQDI